VISQFYLHTPPVSANVIETSLYRRFKAYIDILNHLGASQECGGRVDGQTSRRPDIITSDAAFKYLSLAKTCLKALRDVTYVSRTPSLLLRIATAQFSARRWFCLQRQNTLKHLWPENGPLHHRRTAIRPRLYYTVCSTIRHQVNFFLASHLCRTMKEQQQQRRRQ